MSDVGEAEPNREPPPPPRELVVDAKAAPGDSSDGSGGAMAPFAVSALVSGFLAKYVSLAAAGACLGAVVLFLVVRRKPREGRFVLRIDGDVLEVTRERRPGTVGRITLADLVDVALDRQRHGSGSGGAMTERVRIAFERRAPEPPLFVPEDRLSPIEAQEWYGKVRVFLRKHGWAPEGERTQSFEHR